ncbi:cbb3-type cytochrome c oxidase subunit I [Falsibacillus albus]|uniref:Cytochrome-c oxidase n=1 Tax=Falsibacillus albus TaxID=2478915 RepID=A0A3L7K2P5_9BACI|nr:cbb3-type cytochrome c oxidase subunit I [Falsibacillus albus]RLQ97090.1 cytochrome-c oxidase [Falsibacillus albus]
MGIKLIKISSVYFGLGVLLGYYMSTVHSYDLTPVHVHINLLGWTALTLAGLIYHQFPYLTESPLAKWHFWLHNIGLPVMMAALAGYLLSDKDVYVVGIAAGATITALGVLIFVFHILKNLKS